MGSQHEPVTITPASPAPVGAPPPTGLPTAPSSRTLNTTNLGIPPSMKRVLSPSAPDRSPKAHGADPHSGLRSSPAPISPKFFSAFSPRSSPQPLTGAAAMADERRARESREAEGVRGQSPNPAVNALGALMGARRSFSRPEDAPRTSSSSVDKGSAAGAGADASPAHVARAEDARAQPSAASTGPPNSAAPTATAMASGAAVSSTRAEDGGAIGASSLRGFASAAEAGGRHEDRSSSRAFTFPGPLVDSAVGGTNGELVRGMSLPMPETDQHDAKSMSASKKHKCPYCSTDFTRHHNLKSHLLTHSHEKPFICSTCQARFRRLHDLKRHTKLHTGERPHICSKCGRRFARGDALARHTKGQGGCAGRRASVGSYTGEDESMHAEAVSDDHMEGLVYGEGNDGDHLDDEDDGGDSTRRTTVSSSHVHSPPRTSEAHQSRPALTREPYLLQSHHSTYPPAGRSEQSRSAVSDQRALLGGRGVGSNPNPSAAFHTGSNVPSTSGSSIPIGPGGSSILSHGGMTESPKPLTPTAGIPTHAGRSEGFGAHRRRSPSLANQFRQQHFNRRNNAGSSSQGALPPPSLSGVSHSPHLPPISGLGPSDPKFALSNQPPAAQPPGQLAEQAASMARPQASSGQALSSPPSASSRTIPGGTSMGGGAPTRDRSTRDSVRDLASQSADALWTYVRNLETRVTSLSEEVSSLRNELTRHTRQDGSRRSAA